jgi:hypothetical protein
MKKLLCIALLFTACAAPIALDEDGDPIATDGITITQDRSSIEGTLEPEDIIDSSPEDTTPPTTIPETDWTDDDLTPAAVSLVGAKKWRKGKTFKDITSTGVNTRTITSQFNITAAGFYKLKIKASTGYMFSSKTASASGANVTVPPTFNGSRSACAQFETFKTTYRREEHEYELKLVFGKKVWQTTGTVRTILNSKPPKEKTKRKTAWTFC